MKVDASSHASALVSLLAVLVCFAIGRIWEQRSGRGSNCLGGGNLAVPSLCESQHGVANSTPHLRVSAPDGTGSQPLSLVYPQLPGLHSPVFFVINLRNRADRRTAFARRWAEAGFHFQPWPWSAAEVKAGAELWADKPNKKIHGANFENAGTYGCYLSHLRLLRHCAAKFPGSDVVVMEDDAVFAHDFIARVSAFASIVPAEAELLYLGGTLWRAPLVNGTAIAQGPFLKVDMMGGTHAYIVRAKAVGKIVAALEAYPYRKPVDIQLSEMTSTQQIRGYSSGQPLAGHHHGHSDATPSTNRGTGVSGVASLDGLVERQDWIVGGGWWDKRGWRCPACKKEDYACGGCVGTGEGW